jgi:hypothetical protein
MPARPRETSATRCWKPGPAGGRGAGVALADVDDVDFVPGPAERNRAVFQAVLPPGRFGVVDHLAEGGLADVEAGVAAQPRGVTLAMSSPLMGAFLVKGAGG